MESVSGQIKSLGEQEAGSAANKRSPEALLRPNGDL